MVAGAVGRRQRDVAATRPFGCAMGRSAGKSHPGTLKGSSMVASDSFAEFLREQLGPLGPVAMRRMFGKTGVFCDGVMFGMVRDNTLYFRVDDDNRALFKEASAFPPLNYAKKG